MKALPVSPLAPRERAELPPLDGVRLGTAEVGIRYSGRTDLMVMVFDRPVAAAGVFTRSACASAPVEWCRDRLNGTARAVIVNSGNANAFTGRRGHEACRVTAQAAAEALGCAPEEVLLASTGVIGEPMDASAFSGRLAALIGEAKPIAGGTRRPPS